MHAARHASTPAMEPCRSPWRGRQSLSRGKIGRASPENGAWHIARWVTGTFSLKADFNICLSYGVNYNGGFFLCHHTSRQWLNAHKCNLCSSRGALGGTAGCTGTLLRRARPCLHLQVPSARGQGGRGDQEPGHSSCAGPCRCSP